MKTTKKLFLNSLLVGIFLFLTGCKTLYNPMTRGDIPSSPSAVWDKKPIVVEKTFDKTTTPTDLTSPLPLSNLIDIALKNNPSTRKSWSAAKATAYGHRASLSSYYPVVDYKGSLSGQINQGSQFSDTGEDVVTVGEGGSSATGKASLSAHQINDLNFSYLLLDFGGRRANAEIALQALNASNWKHNFTMQEVILSVLTAYTSLIGNKELVQVYQRNLKDVQVALDAANAMQAAGLSTRTDTLLAQSNLEQVRAQLVQAGGAEKTAVSKLLIDIGLPADADISLEGLPDHLPVIEISGNISSLIELAKKKRPDLGIAVAAIKEKKNQLTLSYSEGMPKLTANLNMNQVNFISSKSPTGYQGTAFLELDFPLFNGFYFVNKDKQLRAEVEEALASLDLKVADISKQVVTNYYMLISSEAALPSAQTAIDYSERSFRGYLAQYKTGSSSILDVLNSLVILNNARAQEVMIRSQWAFSLVNLAFSIGLLNG